MFDDESNEIENETSVFSKCLFQNDSAEEKKEKVSRPSMIPYDPSSTSPTAATSHLLGLSDEILKTLRDPTLLSNTVC